MSSFQLHTNIFSATVRLYQIYQSESDAVYRLLEEKNVRKIGSSGTKHLISI